MHTPRHIAALSIATALCFSTSVSAQDAAAQQQIERLTQKVSELEARLETLESRMESGVAINKALKIEPKPGGWRNTANWELLATGMQYDEVERLLGAPDNTKSIKKFEHWLYGDGRVRLYLNRLKSWDIPSQAKP